MVKRKTDVSKRLGRPVTHRHPSPLFIIFLFFFFFFLFFFLILYSPFFPSKISTTLFLSPPSWSPFTSSFYLFISLFRTSLSRLGPNFLLRAACILLFQQRIKTAFMRSPWNGRNDFLRGRIEWGHDGRTTRSERKM